VLASLGLAIGRGGRMGPGHATGAEELIFPLVVTRTDPECAFE
jgi:hypothetical protein